MIKFIDNLRFRLGIFCLKKFFPCFSIWAPPNPDENEDDATVKAVVFAINEKILDMYSTRRELKDSNS